MLSVNCPLPQTVLGFKRKFLLANQILISKSAFKNALKIAFSKNKIQNFPKAEDEYVFYFCRQHTANDVACRLRTGSSLKGLESVCIGVGTGGHGGHDPHFLRWGGINANCPHPLFGIKTKVSYSKSGINFPKNFKSVLKVIFYIERNPKLAKSSRLFMVSIFVANTLRKMLHAGYESVNS